MIESIQTITVHQAHAIDQNYCGPVDIQCEGWPKPRRFVIWSLRVVGSTKIALFEAAQKYKELFGVMADYAFIRHLPRGIENGVEVEDLMLFEAEWMVDKCVVVGWHYK